MTHNPLVPPAIRGALILVLSVFTQLAVQQTVLAQADAPLSAAEKKAARQAEQERRKAERAAKRAEQEAEQAARKEANRRERDEKSAAVRQAKAEKEQERLALCETFNNWLQDPAGLPPEVMTRRWQGGPGPAGDAGKIAFEAWLFQDVRAEKLFGHRLEAVPEATRTHWQNLGRSCGVVRNNRGQAYGDGQLLNRIFLAPYHQQYLEGIQRIRDARARLSALEQELAALSATGSERFVAIGKELDLLNGFATPEQRDALRSLRAETHRKVLAPASEQQLMSVASQATGLDGLRAMVSARQKAARDAYAANQPVQVPEAFSRKQETLVKALAANESKRIAALGSGLNGLQQGVQWYQHWRSTYQPLLADVPQLGGILKTFEQQRQETLSAAESTLIKEIDASRDTEQLQALFSKYLPLASDRSGKSGAALSAAEARKRADLTRQQLLGNSDAGSSNRSGRGEPTAGDVYDALKAMVDAQNRQAGDTAQRCNNRDFQNDPVLAVQCLQYGVGVGVSADAQNVHAPRFTIVRFKKIACDKAQGQAGYLCDYVLGIQSNLNLPPSLAALMAGNVSQARFVWDGDHWLVLPDYHQD